MQFFAGLDWGGEKHAVCVVDEAGSIVHRFEVAHNREGLDTSSKRLAKICAPDQLAIAIERPTGLVVDTLLDAGFRVVPIHPNVLKACRPRYRAAGGKDDRGDAYVLADVLRTDGHRFRQACPNSDQVKALRALVRTRDDLVGERVALANRLRSLLESFWPGAACIFSEVDSPLTSRIEDDLAKLPAGRVVMSFPRAGRVNAAQIAAEIGDDPRRFVSPDQLAAEAGQAPVTFASGKQVGVTFRWACNQRLRQAITTFADNSRHASPWAADVYRRARARGCNHPHAIRILGRAWLRVLWRALVDGKPYDPSLHRGACKLPIAS